MSCSWIATANTATTATTAIKVTPPTITKKNCYKCSANVPWSPDHATTCSRDKVKRFNSPTKAFRSARFSGHHNRSKHSPAAVNLNDQEHSHGSMDIDISSLPTNYDCKKKTSKQNEVKTNHSLYVPITIENIDTFALVDSGASFSSIDITFANKNNININNNVSGSIIFATNDNKSKRLGTTSKALSLIYGDNDDALIHTSHIFEVLPLSFDTDAVIGLDLMPKLNILITNLAVKHPNKKPAVKEEIDDTPEPNNAPYGTNDQQINFMAAYLNRLFILIQKRTKQPIDHLTVFHSN
ncbi:hypothetical protein G6F22_014795 [Rhizopus arrhizus]|nr:hypothetical protein G6F22_014795 [Rhizopus arrhizus]KAG0940886.1 hypothetical protein G6F31_015091 [Rhizopus arrhizus]